MLFGTERAWTNPAASPHALRLVRRYAAEGSHIGYNYCLRLLKTAPATFRVDALEALDRGLAERAVALGGMGTAGLFDSVAAVSAKTPGKARQFAALTPELTAFIESCWRSTPKEEMPLRVAIRAGVADAVHAAVTELGASATAAARRIVLLGLLAQTGAQPGVPTALSLLTTEQPAAVQAAALELLASHGDDAVSQRLLSYYPSSPATLRRQIREILLGRPASARAFLERVDRKEISPSDVPVDQLRQVALFGDATLDALVHKHWGSVRAGTPEEKLAEIRRLTNDLRAATGDRTRGKELFVRHCATCHKLYGEGGQVGPDLTGVARNDTVALLANIVDPSAVIKAEYLQYAVTTNSGRVLTGIIVGRDGAGITLADAEGKRTTLQQVQIAAMRELDTSIMPENLLKQLRPQEVRDLFRYLQDGVR
jgi:putative heme-binding domain-containing protein